MNLFVTGGAGYIGSATAAALQEAGHSVTVFDSLVTGYRQAIPDSARFVEADLGDQDTLDRALAADSYDAVLHFAAFIEAGESMEQPGKYFENNSLNSLGLFEACVKAGVQRLIYSSSAAVYDSSDEPLTEGARLRPSSIYGQTKLMTEIALEWYRETHGLGYASLRYFNAAGATSDRGEAHQPESHLIPLVLQVALGRRAEISIYGTDYPTPDGTCIRDYIHIADLVSAHILALEALEPGGQMTFNLGNGAGYSVREVIDTARLVTGHAIPAVEADRRPGDAPRLVANSEKICAELGWAPQHPELRDIVASAWEWHQSRPDGYGD